MNILIIDDAGADMDMFADELRLDGHSVTRAKNCEETETAAARFNFDLIVLDLMMPALDGIPPEESDLGYTAGAYLYTKYIAARHESVPFVVLTGVDERNRLFKEAMARLRVYSGFRGYQSKSEVNTEVIIRAATGAP